MLKTVDDCLIFKRKVKKQQNISHPKQWRKETDLTKMKQTQVMSGKTDFMGEYQRTDNRFGLLMLLLTT